MKTTRSTHTPSHDRRKSNPSSGSSVKNLTKSTIGSTSKSQKLHSKDTTYFTNQTLQHIPEKLIPQKQLKQLSPQRKTIYQKQAKVNTPNKATLNYEERLKCLETYYKSRLEELSEVIKQVKEQIDSDQIITAMKDDPASQGFIAMRVKEIVDEGIANEKEMQIHRLMQDKASLQCTLQDNLEQIDSLTRNMNTEANRTCEQIEAQLQIIKQREMEVSELKSKINEREKDCQKMVMQLREIHTQTAQRLEEQTKTAMSEKHSLENEMMLYKKALGELEGRFKVIESQKSILETENQEYAQDSAICKEGYHRLKRETEPLRKQNEELKIRLEEVVGRLKNAEEMAAEAESQKQDLIEKFQKFGQNMQNQNSVTIERLKEKQRKKKESLKEKLQETRNELQNSQIQRQQEMRDYERAKEQLEGAVKAMHQDIKRVHSEWEKRCKEIETEGQKKQAELKSMHALQTEQLQNQYQHLLDSKIQEIESLRAQEDAYVPRQEEYVRGGGYMSQEMHEQRIQELREQQTRDISEFKQEVAKQLEHHESLKEEQRMSRNRQLETHIQKMQEKMENVQVQNEEYAKRIEDVESAREQVKDLLEEERNARIELEIELEKIGTGVIEVCQSLAATTGELSAVGVNNPELYMKVLGKYTKRVAEIFEEHEDIIRRLERRVKEEERKVNESKNSSLELTTQIGKEMQSEIQHVRSQLRAAESSNRLLQEEVDDLERSRKGTKAKLQRAEDEIVSLKERLHKEEKEYSGLMKEKKAAQNTALSYKSSLDRLKMSMSHKVRTALRGMRDQIHRIRMETQSHSITMTSIASSTTRDLLRVFGRQEDEVKHSYEREMKEVKEKCMKEMTVKLYSQEQQFTLSQKSLKERLESEKKDVLDQMRQEQKKWRMHYEEELERLEEDKENLMIKLQEHRAQIEAKSNALQQVREQLSEVQMECSRLKTQYTQNERDTDLRYKKELRLIQNELQEMQHRSVQEIKKMEGEVYSLHSAFVEELKQERELMCKKWNKKLEQAVMEEQQRTGKVQQEMRNLADELSQERRETNKKNHESQEKIEKLEAELREAKVELEQTQKNANRSQEDTIETRSRIKELEIQIETNETAWNQEKRQLQQKQQAKEKEIQELHSMIAKQFKKVNQQKENIMLASQLGCEVKALTNRIHQPK